MLKTVTSKYSIPLALLVIAISANVAVGQQRPSTPSSSSVRTTQQTSNEATTVFRGARDLIDEGQWQKAQEKLDYYLRTFPNDKSIEPALYWLAYAQNKLGRIDQMRGTIDRLLQKYPNTNWREDARLLLAQAPGAYVRDYQSVVAPAAIVAEPGGAVTVTPLPPMDAPMVYAPQGPVTVAPPQTPQAIYAPGVIGFDTNISSGNDDDPCEFKIVVLQALFQTDLQRGIMAASEWLKTGSTQTPRCKSAALTLLGRHGGKSVTPVILGVARSETDMKLRARAISTLGTTNDDSVIEPLRDFALNSPDNEVGEAAVYALSQHTGERAMTVLSEIAYSGKSTAQRKLAISSISTRPGEPAVDALFRIYDADQSVDIRKAVIYGFGNRRSERAGTRLLEIARSSDNIELRKVAIGAISRRGGDKAIEFLLNLYDTEKNEEVKDVIMNALGSGTSTFFNNPEWAVVAGQAGGSSRMNDERVITKLIEIARDQKAPMERRKRAIGWLSRSKHPKVLEFLQELLK
ncbi:MAG TPA: HEAT repeat domain-containing protein [Pyrinomonadaceae bacterium]|nr:HEAT repeat domain-containing protein [Pyrinomonadaceae bacterium]